MDKLKSMINEAGILIKNRFINLTKLSYTEILNILEIEESRVKVSDLKEPTKKWIYIVIGNLKQEILKKEKEQLQRIENEFKYKE